MEGDHQGTGRQEDWMGEWWLGMIKMIKNLNKYMEKSSFLKSDAAGPQCS